jgi:Kef-type K+ transport system membrane component KefB
MMSFFQSNPELAWALVLILAWFTAEYVQRWLEFPRICVYALVGFLCASGQLGILSESADRLMLLLANVAFGFILFEVGYRINLVWLYRNPWILATAVIESGLTFLVVFFLLTTNGIDTGTSLLLATLVMSTSPAAIITIVNEQKSSGQVTERALHLSAINCVLAALVFKVLVGFYVFEVSGSLLEALYQGAMVFCVSLLLGAGFGVGIPLLFRKIGGFSQDGTMAFAMAVIVLVTFAHAMKLSAIVAALAFGIIARHRRIALSQARRNFGELGKILTVILFVFVSSMLEWSHIKTGFALACMIVAARFVTKTIGVTLLSYPSGISWKKGFLTGVALSPISVFVILTLEQTRYLGVDLLDQLKVLAAITLILEIIGPILTQRALIWAGESQRNKEL